MKKKKKVRIKWNRVIIALFILVSIVFIPIKLFFKNSGRPDIADDLVLIDDDTLTLKSCIEWMDKNGKEKQKD